MLDATIGHKHHNNIEIIVLGGKHGPDVFGVMIGAKDEEDPFHRSLNPSAMNLLHLVFLDV